MKILLLTTHLNMGGITRYLMTLTRGLVARGHQVHIASGGGEMLPHFETFGANCIELKIKTKSELDPNLYLSLIPLKKYIHEHKIELVHAQTRVTQVMGTLLNAFHKIPYVSTCHGYFKARFSRKLWPCWGQTIAISPAVREHLINDFNTPEANIHLVTHGINLEDFEEITAEERKASRRHFGIKDEVTIGMIARLSDVKGQDILIAAMPRIVQEIPRAKLMLFGEGKMKEQLLELIREFHLQQYIEFYPIVARTREALASLDCFVVPSRQEGLGLSVMEAQTCAVAVVASRVGGIPTLIEDGKTGVLVKPHDVKALAAAIVSVLKDDEFRYALGLEARKHALKNYSSDLMITKTIDVYQKVLGRP